MSTQTKTKNAAGKPIKRSKNGPAEPAEQTQAKRSKVASTKGLQEVKPEMKAERSVPTPENGSDSNATKYVASTERQLKKQITLLHRNRDMLSEVKRPHLDRLMILNKQEIPLKISPDDVRKDEEMLLTNLIDNFLPCFHF